MLALSTLKTSYKTYLTTHYTKPSSIDTALSDTFYLWRRQGSETFWKAVNSDDETARALLLEAITANNDSTSQLSSFLSGIRLFRQFWSSDQKLKSLSKIKTALDLYGFDSEITDDGVIRIHPDTQFNCEDDGTITHCAGPNSGIWYAIAAYSKYKVNDELIFPNVDSVLRYLACIWEVTG